MTFHGWDAYRVVFSAVLGFTLAGALTAKEAAFAAFIGAMLALNTIAASFRADYRNKEQP